MLEELYNAIGRERDELAKAKATAIAVDLKGLPHILHGETLKPLTAPTFPTLHVGTLAGLVDALKGTLFTKPLAIVVNTPLTVSAITGAEGQWLQRGSFAKATAEAVPVTLGNYMDIEEFNVQLRARFGLTEDRDKLIRILGNLSGGILRTSTDDGITQQVSVRAGVSLLGEERIQNPVALRPYRTFSDIEQPVSAYIVRLKQDKDQAPKAALFEADGGLWKRTAMDSIHKFLVDAALGVPVLR